MCTDINNMCNLWGNPFSFPHSNPAADTAASHTGSSRITARGNFDGTDANVFHSAGELLQWETVAAELETSQLHTGSVRSEGFKHGSGPSGCSSGCSSGCRLGHNCFLIALEFFPRNHEGREQYHQFSISSSNPQQGREGLVLPLLFS